MKVIAVIGMNYGDEGKGHITNYFCDENTLNVRFNGGAQAAHAVFMSDGRNHIFHHFGSGSLRGARTLLSSKFIVNPLAFVQELYELSAKTPMREVFIDPRCRVTTPWDMMINAFNSEYHGKKDTCGFGINETVERSCFNQLKITGKDLLTASDSNIKATMETIENDYLPYRLEKLELPKDLFYKFKHKSFGNQSVSAMFLKLRGLMMDKIVKIHPDDDIIRKFYKKDPKKRKIVFEGAQGMLLDQNRKDMMPYLTRSNTGIKNALECLKSISVETDLEICLVTRTYLTRHGDGPIWNQCERPLLNREEITNPQNDFQGSMRFGHLDMRWYNKAFLETETEIENGKPRCIQSIDIFSAMTCCDHIEPSGFKYCLDNHSAPIFGSLNDFKNIKLQSYGPSEEHIK
jgi:adenylosuccinate synthase